MAKTKRTAQPLHWVFFSIVTVIFVLLIMNWTFSIPMWRYFDRLKTGEAFTKQNCLADECLAVSGVSYPTGKLTSEAEKSIVDAIKTEYKSLNQYTKAVSRFGVNRPFSMISRSKEMNVLLLKALADKYGIKVPENTDAWKATVEDTFVKTCKASSDLEKETITLYQTKYIPPAKDYEDISLVMNKILSTSQNRHLPAFKLCQ